MENQRERTHYYFYNSVIIVMEEVEIGINHEEKISCHFHSGNQEKVDIGVQKRTFPPFNSDHQERNTNEGAARKEKPHHLQTSTQVVKKICCLDIVTNVNRGGSLELELLKSNQRERIKTRL